MILGIGIDIIDIKRIRRVFDKFGERFLKRVFTPLEITKAQTRQDIAPTLAKRFAAKEACAKALGTGIYQGVYWHDIGVVNQSSGQPGIVLTGGAARRLREMTPTNMQTKIDLSLTDDYPQAQAFVIISAIPYGQQN
jgi:holo-[acyl-carrier protein] synthase